MILASDADYIQTRSIKLGQSQMDADLVPLAKWIDATFGVKTLNILRGRTKANRITLQIVLEFEADTKIFHRDNSYDEAKQALIAAKFYEMEKERARGRSGLLNRLFSRHHEPENIWVCFSAFDCIAKEDANNAIAKKDIDSLKVRLADPRLWTISRSYGYTTFFVYTNAEITQVKADGSLELWSRLYYELLRAHNRFGYFQPATFSLLLGSKEVFDTKYQSNWFYYYK